MERRPARVVLHFSLPAICSMLLTALVTVADGLFIGNYVGKEGIAAVNLGLPLIYLFLGVGLMAAVGGAALAGMALGRGDTQEARRAFCQTAATAGVLAAATAGLVLVFLEPLLGLFGAAAPVRAACGLYYRIRLPELVVMVLNSAFGIFVRASVLASLCGLGLYLWYFARRARVFRLGRAAFSGAFLRQSLANGFSELVGELSTGIAMFAYNLVILRLAGADGVTAFTIVGYAAYLFSMVVVGFGQGSSPLISFCVGANRLALAGRLRRVTARLATGAGAALFCLTWAFAVPCGRLFVRSGPVLELIGQGAGLFALSFLLSGFNALTSFYFTAAGRAAESAAISLARGLVVLLGCILLLPRLWGMTGVWLAAPVTEGLTLLLSLGCLRREAGRRARG